MKSIQLHQVTNVQSSIAVSPTSSMLSVLFDNAICINQAKDTSDASPNSVNALAFDILLDIQIDGPHNLRCDVRGAFINSDLSCWAIVNMHAHGRWGRVDSVRERGVFTERLKLTLANSGTYKLSLLMVAQRDAALPNSMAQIHLDSVDFSLVPRPKSGRKNKSK
jgi:hypothetical protein